MQIQIIFNISVDIYNGDKKIKTTTKHIEGIIANIKKNSRTNSEGKIFSCEFGIIHLLNCEIVKNTGHQINQSNVLKIKFIVEANCPLTIESAEEIIWTVFPSSYSNDNCDKFTFSLDGKFKETYYVLNIGDTPSNILINQIF